MSIKSFHHNEFIYKTMEKEYDQMCPTLRNQNEEILIDLLSNWGTPSFIGLTEIKIFDETWEEIPLSYQDLHLFKNNQIKNTNNLQKLINGQYDTNDCT